MEVIQKTLMRRITLKPEELSNVSQNLLNNLKNAVERKCETNGYIIEVKRIVSRSEGIVDSNSFNGITNFDIIYIADTYQPNINDIIFECSIIEIKKVGIFLQKDGIFRIIVKNNDLPNDFENKFKIGQTVNIRILGFNCDKTSEYINVVGYIHYYYVPEIRMLMQTLSYPEEQEPIDKIEVSFKDKKEELKTIYENLAPFERVERIKHEIDKIDPSIWDFYKMFCNPFELIYPKLSYASESDAIYQGKRVPSRAYFKLLEIFNNVKGLSKFMRLKDIKIACLAEAPGGFIRAIGDKIGADNIQVIHTISQGDTSSLKYSEDLLNFKEQKKIKITYGNLFSPKDVDKFIKDAQGSMLITADGGISTKEVDYDQEKELYKLILAEVYVALQIAVEGSTLVLKIFDTNTKAMVDLIWLLNSYFKDVCIYKPQMSRPANAERYLICAEFKASKVSNQLLNELRGLIVSQGYINELLPSTPQSNFVYTDFSNRLRGYGYRLSDNQYKKIKEILEIIRINEYRLPKPDVMEEYLYYQRLFGEEWARQNYLKEATSK